MPEQLNIFFLSKVTTFFMLLFHELYFNAVIVCTEDVNVLIYMLLFHEVFLAVVIC